MTETDHAGSLDQRGPGGRGQLRIYLGSAAGVGKTFAMLGEGHRRAERGTDVVVAFVETHGRPHTAAQIEGLEVLPRRRLEYRGTSFDEMDIDAVLARRPEVAVCVFDIPVPFQPRNRETQVHQTAPRRPRPGQRPVRGG